MKKKKLKGLTIIELLIVITVIALLVLVVALMAPTQIKKGRDARRKADFQRMKTALYDYYFDHDCFPLPGELPKCGENFGSGETVYLNNFPCDPVGTPYVYAVRKSGGQCKQWFRLFTNLEVSSDPIIDKIHCRQGCGPDQHSDFNYGERGCTYNYGVASTNTQIYRGCSFAYVCNPGGICEGFEDPWRSECPVIFDNDTCDGQCDDPANRCKNSSGKQIPEE